MALKNIAPMVFTVLLAGLLQISTAQVVNGACRIPGTYPVPGDCSRFYECADRIDLPFIKECPPATLYNQNTQQCDWPTNVDCARQQQQSRFRQPIAVTPRFRQLPPLVPRFQQPVRTPQILQFPFPARTTTTTRPIVRFRPVVQPTRTIRPTVSIPVRRRLNRVDCQRLAVRMESHLINELQFADQLCDTDCVNNLPRIQTICN